MTNNRQSPGFRRMAERLGPEAFERLRLDTLKKQEEALASVAAPKAARPLTKEERAQAIVRDTIKGKR